PVHTANTLQEHLHLTAHTDVQTLAKAASWVPFQLVGVIDRALSRDKQKRWATAFEMQGALKAAVEEADVVLVPDAPTVLDPEPAITPAFAQDSPPIAAVQPAAGSPAIPPSSAQAAVVAPPSRSPSARPGAPGSGRPSAPSQRAAVHVPASRPANLIVPSAIGSGRAPMSSPISARPASSGMSSRASAEHDEVDREERPTRPPPPPSSAKIQVVPESIRSVTRTPLPAKPPPSVDAAKKNGSAPEEEEEELIQRPDAPTIMDPQHEEEEAPKPQRLQPLAKWTERLLQAEAAETAVSRGIVPKPPGSAGPADLKATARPAVLDAGRSELQKATPVGVISRPLQQRQIVPVPPPPSHDMSAPPGSIRIATRFEVDDTMQSPQGLAGVPSHPLPLPPAPGPHGALPPPPHAPIEPYTPPPGPPTTTSSATSRVVFYGLLIATVVVTFFVVRRMHLGVPAVKHTSPSTTPTPTESAPALPPPPPPHSAKH
ncbi:MAG: hypothetical protein ACREJX_02285, partial [Polyangiaceae bacterium]